jgi:hypothetical protein
MSALYDMMDQELDQPTLAAARTVADEIRRRHGPAVVAVLFYGSCLRQHTSRGVLDFYVLVDSYRAVFASRVLAVLNAVLPPNVLYLEVGDGPHTLRAKYAVISMRDFVSGASTRSVPALIWARFCQPARLVYSRDQASRSRVVGACAEAVLTLVGRMAALLPARFQTAELWQRGFRETYRTELRAEQPGTVQALYHSAVERYGRVAEHALSELRDRGQVVRVVPEPGRAAKGNSAFPFEWQVTISDRQRRRLRWDWKVRRALAKGRYALWLLKSGLTFDDWLPYVAWKISRHAGLAWRPTDRQRRHPFLLGGPAILRLLVRRHLR